MDKRSLRKAIEQEIIRLNQEIDLRIIRGLSYDRQSRRHRFLTTQLRILSLREDGSWISRMAHMTSVFF